MGSATMVSHLQIPFKTGEENSFIEGEKEVGSTIANKEFMTSHWLRSYQE